MRHELVPTRQLSTAARRDIVHLCSLAYQEDFAQYLHDIGPGMHLMAIDDGRLVSHAAWVDRELRIDDRIALRSAYVEAVATLPGCEGRGHASALLEAIVRHVSAAYDIAALSPAHPAYYERLGWLRWEGPLAYRQDGVLVDTPEEELMVKLLAGAPLGLDRNAKLVIDWRPGEVW
jgi:aminoglycoside 2'-N-acetyltransferase I